MYLKDYHASEKKSDGIYFVFQLIVMERKGFITPATKIKCRCIHIECLKRATKYKRKIIMGYYTKVTTDWLKTFFDWNKISSFIDKIIK